MQRGIIKNVKDFKYLLPSAIALLLTIIIISCNSTEPERKINISVEDVSCTEVWLKLEGATSNEIKLERDGLEISKYTVLEGNILCDTSLQPNTEYTYKATLINDADKNMEATAITLDTTSSNYTWEKFYFGGDKGSCYLKDVAIIDENNIWAVGHITLADTNENGFTSYNVAHWNGEDWELLTLKHNCRLYYPNCSGDTLLYTIASSIFAISADNIWISSGTVHHYDGSSWKEEAGILGAGEANEIWGTEDALWFVGSDGFITCRSSNGSWNRIESGTELDIQDIYGSNDKKSGESEILAIASDRFKNNGYSLLSIQNNVVDQIQTDGLPWSLHSVWFIRNREYYLCGDGIYKTKSPNFLWIKNKEFPTYYKDRIRGIGFNDIVVSGSNGLLSHFNGKGWSHYMGQELDLIDGRYNSIDIKDNIVVAVGEDNRQAVIIVGKR